jgi:ubiquinone/menaquinone biosynthesis C-methylase UbiE
MTASPPGMAGVFDRAADRYDAVGIPWFGPIAQGLVEELDVRPGERVLDLGCGRGAALLPLARAVGPTGTALGLDLAPRMVELTARDARDLPQVEVRVGDASAPDVPAQSYDVVSCCLVLFFLPDPAAAVRSWVPALAPGGRVGVTTFGPQDSRWQSVDELFRPYLPPQLRDPRTTGRTGPFASDEGVAALLTGAGLVDVRTAHRTVEAVFSTPERWVSFSWSHGQRAMWEHVPEGERDDLERRALELLREVERRDGGLRFTQDVRHTLGRRP